MKDVLMFACLVENGPRELVAIFSALRHFGNLPSKTSPCVSCHIRYWPQHVTTDLFDSSLDVVPVERMDPVALGFGTVGDLWYRSIWSTQCVFKWLVLLSLVVNVTIRIIEDFGYNVFFHSFVRFNFQQKRIECAFPSNGVMPLHFFLLRFLYFLHVDVLLCKKKFAWIELILIWILVWNWLFAFHFWIFSLFCNLSGAAFVVINCFFTNGWACHADGILRSLWCL